MFINQKTKTKKKTFQEIEKENELNENNSQEEVQELNESIDPNDLIKYISLWDFSKVKDSIKNQIILDQQNYNNDIADSLNKLNESVETFTKANEQLVETLWLINNLLAYTKWKDYFINWFNDVKFEISELNLKTLNSGVEMLSSILSDRSTLELLSWLREWSIILPNTEVKTITSEKSNVPVEKTEIETEAKDTFDIATNFSDTESKEENLPEIEEIIEDNKETVDVDNKVEEVQEEENIIEEDKSTETESKSESKFDITSQFSDLNEDIDNDESNFQENIVTNEPENNFGYSASDLDEPIEVEEVADNSDKWDYNSTRKSNPFGNFESLDDYSFEDEEETNTKQSNNKTEKPVEREAFKITM